MLSYFLILGVLFPRFCVLKFMNAFLHNVSESDQFGKFFKKGKKKKKKRRRINKLGVDSKDRQREAL